MTILDVAIAGLGGVAHRHIVLPLAYRLGERKQIKFLKLPNEAGEVETVPVARVVTDQQVLRLLALKKGQVGFRDAERLGMAMGERCRDMRLACIELSPGRVCMTRKAKILANRCDKIAGKAYALGLISKKSLHRRRKGLGLAPWG